MNKSFQWRIQAAVVFMSLGILYYLVFLFYLCGGVPIEKIHYFMTDGWPNFCADNVPYVAPGFLFLGLYLWYSYTMKNKPKPIYEPEYKFEFHKVEKPTDHVFLAEPKNINEVNLFSKTTEDTETPAENSDAAK